MSRQSKYYKKHKSEVLFRKKSKYALDTGTSRKNNVATRRRKKYLKEVENPYSLNYRGSVFYRKDDDSVL